MTNTRIFWEIRSNETISVLTQDLLEKINSIPEKENVWTFDNMWEAWTPSKDWVYATIEWSLYIWINGKWIKLPTEKEITELVRNIIVSQPVNLDTLKTEIDKLKQSINTLSWVDASWISDLKTKLDKILVENEVNLDDMKALVESKIWVADVINDLTSDDTTKPLSAAQGKVLKELADWISQTLGSANLEEIRQVVEFINQNKQTLSNLSIWNIAWLNERLSWIDSSLAWVKTKADKITVNNNVNLDQIKSTADTANTNASNAKSKTDLLTVTGSTNLDDMRNKINEFQNKLNNITVSSPINLNNLSVIDNLNTDDGSKPLSARQGKYIKETLLGNKKIVVMSESQYNGLGNKDENTIYMLTE